MGEQDDGRPAEGPGPYRGVFGEPNRPMPPAGGPGQPGPAPAGRGYSGAWAGIGDRPPTQVVAAAAIGYGLAGLCVLLGLMMATSAGDQIAEVLTGSAERRGLVLGVILLCGLAYGVPAFFLRKRRSWARWTLLVVASFGIAGGLSSLPNSILGLVIHLALLLLLLQQPTRLWFLHR